MMRIKIVVLTSLFALFVLPLQAQRETLDKIVAVVGNRIVLESELNQNLKELQKNDAMLDDSYKCTILQNIIGQYVLCEQAERDSVEVSDEEIEGNLDNRIRYFIQMYGSQEKMEEVTGKTVGQIKDEYRKLFKDKMLAERMQGQMMNSVKITPNEVRAFFNRIPKDSLPTYPSMVEIGQIVLKPQAGKDAEEHVKQDLENIRKQIIDGEASFETMAGIYSEDPGSKDNGGLLTNMKRDELDPAFAAGAFKLQNGEISNVIKSSFGYHLIQMVQRKGDKATMRHILMRPRILQSEVDVCLRKTDSIKSLVQSGKYSFPEAAGKFSQDERTKLTGGMFTSGQGASSFLAQDELEPDVILAIDGLKSGEYTSAQVFTDPMGDKACRFVYVKNIIPPHTADLSLDYNKIMQVALAEKQNKYLIDWLKTEASKFYIKVDDEYGNCEELKSWVGKK